MCDFYKLVLLCIIIKNIYCQNVDGSKPTILEYKNYQKFNQYYYESPKYKNVPYTYDEVAKKGGYEFSYFTYNEIKREEKGTFVDKGDGQGELVVVGSYSYNSPDDNKRIFVDYVADSNGFRPKIREEYIIPSLPSLSGALQGSLAGGGLG